MKAKRGPKKPAKDMTDDEVGETIFGKRTIGKVRKELEETPEPAGKKEKSVKGSSIDRENS